MLSVSVNNVDSDATYYRIDVMPKAAGGNCGVYNIAMGEIHPSVKCESSHNQFDTKREAEDGRHNEDNLIFDQVHPAIKFESGINHLTYSHINRVQGDGCDVTDNKSCACGACGQCFYRHDGLEQHQQLAHHAE